MWRSTHARALTVRAAARVHTSSNAPLAISAAATRRMASLAAATAAAPAALAHASRLSLFSPSSSLSALSTRRAFSSSAKDADPAAPATDGDSASNPFAADSDLWQLDTGGSSLSGAALDQSAPESYGVVMGVNKGIVSVDGVHTAHIGSCLQFFSKEDVRQQNDSARKKRIDEQRQRSDADSHRLGPSLLHRFCCARVVLLSSRRKLPHGVWWCRSTAISPRR